MVSRTRATITILLYICTRTLAPLKANEENMKMKIKIVYRSRDGPMQSRMGKRVIYIYYNICTYLGTRVL